MKHTVITTLLLCSYSLYSQTQSVGLTDNTTGTFFNFTNNPVTGSPSLNGNIGINFDELGPNLFLATSTIHLLNF